MTRLGNRLESGIMTLSQKRVILNHKEVIFPALEESLSFDNGDSALDLGCCQEILAR